MRRSAFRFTVPPGGARLDRLVADATGRGRRTVRRWLMDGSVSVDGRVANPSFVPREGSEVVVMEPEPAAAPGLGIHVVFENERLVVVSKPAGLHSESGKSPGSVAELLAARHEGQLDVGERPEEAGLVHRIDRDTSGLVVAARDRRTWLALRAAFSQGRSRKQYLALVAGELTRAIDIDTPLARRGARMIVAGRHDAALDAYTEAAPLETGRGWTLVLATMRTGVMHQVRAHLAASGHPLIGDDTYGGPRLADATRSGQLLHAMRVEIGGAIDVTTGAPADFVAALAQLRRLSPSGAATSSYGRERLP